MSGEDLIVLTHGEGVVVAGVVAGSTYGCNRSFIAGLLDRRFEFIVETRATSKVRIVGQRGLKWSCPHELIRTAKLTKVDISVPDAAKATLLLIIL